MGVFDQILSTKLLSGLGLLSILSGLWWGYRLIMAYCRETREEYRNRLHDTAMELERQKMVNVKLELKVQTLEYLYSLRDKGK